MGVVFFWGGEKMQGRKRKLDRDIKRQTEASFLFVLRVCFALFWVFSFSFFKGL